MREACCLWLSACDRARLAAVATDRNSPQKHVWRARIVLLSADRLGTVEIMRRTGKAKPSVWRWQARYLEATTCGVRVASIYLPNGNPIGTGKFDYKLAWMERLRAHARALLELDEPVVLGGDYNVIPNDDDTFSVRAMADDAYRRAVGGRVSSGVVSGVLLISIVLTALVVWRLC